MRGTTGLVVAAVLACGSAFAAEGSAYTSVNDRKACRYEETKASGDGPISCEFRCPGPAPGVSTRLLSCGDYDHLFVQLDGGGYSTWGAMTALGGFAGLANRGGLVEWVFAGPGRKRDNLKALIVRFQGTDAETGKVRSALSVFSLARDGLCWKGNYPTNDAARAAVDSAACQAPLAAEGK